MRIAHVITRLILGGAQENTILNCEDLIRTYGDDVLLITGPPLGPEGSLLERAKKRIPLAVVPSLRRAIRPFSDLTAYRELRKILLDYRPDVVHTHSAKAGILGRAAAHSLGVKAIIHGVHGAPFHPYQNFIVREFYRRCERWAADRTHAFVSVADAMTELLVLSKVAPKEKFTTVYSGMETGPFLNSALLRGPMREKCGFSNDNIVVGKIARLFHLKGHEYVIEAAKTVIKRNPNLRFLFVGDGILSDSFKAKIERAGLSGYFTFTGLVPPEEIPGIISACDMIVHTSLREGLARVLPQALLSGKPVISYDIDGAREVVITGETGILLPPKSIERFADAILLLADDPDLRHRLGEEGRKRFAQRFDHDFMTARIRELYEKVLANGPATH